MDLSAEKSEGNVCWDSEAEASPSAIQDKEPDSPFAANESFIIDDSSVMSTGENPTLNLSSEAYIASVLDEAPVDGKLSKLASNQGKPCVDKEACSAMRLDETTLSEDSSCHENYGDDSAKIDAVRFKRLKRLGTLVAFCSLLLVVLTSVGVSKARGREALSAPTKATTTSLIEKLTEEPTKKPTERPTERPTVAPTNGSTNKTPSPTLGPTAPPRHTAAPTSWNGTYVPGNLTREEVGLMLSEGLRARIIATSGESVEYSDGTFSGIPFHGRPDFGATFPDTRPFNRGGWVYASNSEMEEEGAGGVGSLTFNKDGEVIDYRMVLEKTTMNCGGGKTPW